MGRRRLPCLGLILALALSGCTYADREPGLFGRETESPTPSSVRPDLPNPALPVVGEAVWTGPVTDGGETRDLQVRVAVHALRRVAGATVLDYSVTPLADPDHPAGSVLPSSVDLQLLDPQDGTLRMGLLEPRAGRFYRPLVRAGWHRTDCLCTPLSQVQQNLRVGRTSLLQAAFPSLSQALSTVDVYLATVPPYDGVPISPVGTVPLAVARVDLARPVAPVDPADPRDPNPTTPVFTGETGQQLEITVDAVLAAGTSTALVWTVHAITDGPGLADDLDPTILPSGGTGPVLHPRQIRRGNRRTCLCTDVSEPRTLLTASGTRASGVTVLPALPRGTSRVDVAFPGAETLRGLPTTTAADGTFRTAGPVPQPVGSWTDASGPPLGWSVDDWPTPLPPARSVSRFPPVVDELVR